MKETDASLVFSSEWIENAKHQFGHLQRSDQSWAFLVATVREAPFSLMNQQIENWVAGLPQAARARMISNLRTKDNFWHSYHELVVGNFLKELGLETEFERQFGEQTPDWFAYSKDGSQSFIVEVFTVNASEDSVGFENRQLSDLMSRLGKLRLDFALKIACLESSAIKQLDSGRSKQIANAVRGWLQNYNTFSEPSLFLDGFAFNVIHRDRGYSALQLAGPARSINAPWQPLREKIEGKIHKYKDLVLSNNIPLIVAVAPGLGTDYSSFEMQNILLGGVFVESPLSHGLFARKPLLSAALFVDGRGTLDWTIKYFPNPNATFQLPANILDGYAVRRD